MELPKTAPGVEPCDGCDAPTFILYTGDAPQDGDRVLCTTCECEGKFKHDELGDFTDWIDDICQRCRDRLEVGLDAVLRDLVEHIERNRASSATEDTP